MANRANGRMTVAFGDVVRKVSDRVDPETSGLERYVAGEHMDTDDLRIRRWGVIGDGYLGPAFHLRFKPGQVLYGSRRTYLRKVALPDFEGVTANTTFVLEPKDPAVLLPELLPFVMSTKSFHTYSIEHSKGSVNPYINFSDLASYEFALPPLDEQRRISRAGGAYSEYEEALRSLLERLHISGQALLDRIFDLVQARDATSRLNNGRRGWIRLGELAPLQTGFPFKSAAFSDTGDRLLRGSNVGVDRTVWNHEDTRYWPRSRREEFREFGLRARDIVIAMDRPFISTGFKVARLLESDLPALLLQRVGRFQPTDDSAGELVWAFVHSRSFKAQLEAQQEGTDLPHISKAQIENTLVPLSALGDQSGPTTYGQVISFEANIRERLDKARVMRGVLIEAALT